MKALRAEGVAIGYGGRLLAAGLELTVTPGAMAALVGANGAGKSTLLRILAGEQLPWAGRCTVNGHALWALRPAELARLRAVMPQDTGSAVALRVREVVALGRVPHGRHTTPQRNDGIVETVLGLTALTPLAERPVASLSGGERQRVHFARALAQVWDTLDDNVARYLLLDEPTANLDIGHQQRLLGLARSVSRQGLGVLAVVHDLNLAATYADVLYLFPHGGPLIAGGVKDVLRSELLERVYGNAVTVLPRPGGGAPLIVPLPPPEPAAYPATLRR